MKNLYEIENKLYVVIYEKIEPNNYYITTSNTVAKADIGGAEVANKNKSFKIIITTDKLLINDGVQAINDEFLEWFAFNPSCEKVKIESWQTKGEWDLDYKIIIPQENWLSNNPQCKQIESCSKSLSKKCVCPKEEPKQETLEEAAERIKKELIYAPIGIIPNFNDGFIEGAKWQQERMYTVVIEFAEWIRSKDFQTTSKDNWIGLDMKYYTSEELFEQFKTK